jgi:hypothetical protein
MAKKPLEIDMIAGSALRDTQGEMLSVEGADITDLINGVGRLNDNHGKGHFNSIGRVTSAKKIFKAEDCDNERQTYYWNKVKAPYIYVAGQLYDDEDHPNAKAAAAILRHIHKADAPLHLKASVEGGVISRGVADPSLLARTKIHSVALTFTPANNTTIVEPINLEKSSVDDIADLQLIKSVLHLAQTNVPSFRHITRDASAGKIQENLNKIAELLNNNGLEVEIIMPTRKEIIDHALEHKIKDNVAKISSMMTQLKDEELDKGIKNAVAGAALAGAMAMPQTAQAPKAPAPQVQQQQALDLANLPKNHQEVYEKVASTNPMLGAIGLKESSGAKNYKHRTIASKGSPHEGQTAGGMFGMMPNSAAYVLKNDHELAKKYPKLVEAAKDMKKNHKLFTDALNQDPNAAADFAVALYNRNKSRTKSPEQLAYSWLNGLKGSWNKVKSGGHGAIKDNPYVKEIMQYYNAHKNKSNQQVKKALTAGYGGSAAPTGRVYGAVLQAESLEGGIMGFKYITCDKCGKEQIYAKHQVKCRDCNNTWSLEKLYREVFGSEGKK